MRNSGNYSFYIILISIIFLLLGCTTQSQTAATTQSTVENSAFTTVGTLVDSEVRYFTLEDFASIVIGESTIEDVYNITEESYAMALTGTGGFCEYPMQDGKCICIEFGVPNWVIKSIKVRTPTINNQSQTSDTDIHSQSPVWFSNYEKYIAFFRDTGEQTPVSKIYTSTNIKAYITDIREGKRPLVIPYRCEDPVPVVKGEDTLAEPVQVCSVLFVSSEFDTVMDDKSVIIRIYAMTAEENAMSAELSCSELIAVLKPLEPNVDKYDSGQYEAVFEDSAVIDGISRSMLVQQSKDGMETIYFVLDGCIVEFHAPVGTVTKDWLKDFSVVAY